MDSQIRIIGFFGFGIGNTIITIPKITVRVVLGFFQKFYLNFFNETPQLLYDFYTIIVTLFLMDQQYVHGDFSLGKTYACLVYHYCNWRDQSFSECLIF